MRVVADNNCTEPTGWSSGLVFRMSRVRMTARDTDHAEVSRSHSGQAPELALREFQKASEQFIIHLSSGATKSVLLAAY